MGALWFFVSQWQLVLIGLAITVGLGYAAFILKNWKLAAGALVLIAFVTYSGIQYKNGYDDHLAKTLAEQKKMFEERERTALAAAELERQRAAAAISTAEDLQRQIDETPNDPRVCGDGDLPRRLRSVR